MFFLETFDLGVETTAGTDILDLTESVQEQVQQTGVTAGLLTLFISGSTAALTTIEYESGAVHDLKVAIERLFPKTWTTPMTAAGGMATAMRMSGRLS